MEYGLFKIGDRVEQKNGNHMTGWRGTVVCFVNSKAGVMWDDDPDLPGRNQWIIILCDAETGAIQGDKDFRFVVVPK